jgi:phosphoribosylformylglycinamidine cyclo-ligase
MDQDPSHKSKKISYKDSGVDVEKADQTVEWMKEHLAKSEDQPHKSSVVSGIGGFSALFAPNFSELEEPVLVSATDGIGTKLLMGLESGLTEGLAQDLVAMCANDLVCVGAEPLFFLDYFASSNLDYDFLKVFFSRLKKACAESNMALIGGETAELPGLYSKGHFDAAGFSVGVVDKKAIWGPHKVESGDRLILVGSSGFHSNGYSLLRKLFGEDGGEFKEELMKPTVLYWSLIKRLKELSGIKACAHITGGGMDNLLRVLPKGSQAKIKDWQWTDIVCEASKRSSLSKEDMLKTFNCGVGLILVVSKNDFETVKSMIEPDYSLVSEGAIEFKEGLDSRWIIEE